MLAAVGHYAVLVHTVTQRIGETGIRLALGARRAQLLRLLLYVSAHDPLVFTAVPFLLFIVASAAVWIPARRASAADPVVALRAD